MNKEEASLYEDKALVQLHKDIDSLLATIKAEKDRLIDIQYALIYNNYLSVNDWMHEIEADNFYEEYKAFVSKLKKTIPKMIRWQNRKETK